MIKIQLPTDSCVFVVISTENIESRLFEKFFPFSISTHESDNFEMLIMAIDCQLKVINKQKKVIYTKKIENEQARLKTIIDIIRENTIIKKNMCIMHAAFINFYGKGLLFLGESGTGKSTLSAFLNSQKKIQCYSDDIVLIDDELNVVCFSKFLCLRKPSLNLIDFKEPYVYDSFLDRYKIKSQNSLNHTQMKVDAIYALCREEIELPFEKEVPNAFEILLKNMYLPFSLKKNILITSKIIQKHKIFELHYNNLELVLNFLLKRY